MKSVKQWLETIADEEIRDKALKNMKPDSALHEVYDLSQAIMSAFTWDETPEGWDYWDFIYINS